MSCRTNLRFVDPASKEFGTRLATARRFLADLGLGDAVVFDHIGVQTHSAADYAHVKAELSAMGACLSERFVGGRHICNLAIRPNGRVQVDTSPLVVELFAPKPDQVDTGKPPRLWHVAFLLRDLAEHLPTIERAGVRISMRLTVGAKEVLFLLADGGEEIELASLPLA